MLTNEAGNKRTFEANKVMLLELTPVSALMLRRGGSDGVVGIVTSFFFFFLSLYLPFPNRIIITALEIRWHSNDKDKNDKKDNWVVIMIIIVMPIIRKARGGRASSASTMMAA